MKRSQRWNTLLICPCRDWHSGGSDVWSNILPTRPRRRTTKAELIWITSGTYGKRDDYLGEASHKDRCESYSNPQPEGLQCSAQPLCHQWTLMNTRRQKINRNITIHCLSIWYLIGSSQVTLQSFTDSVRHNKSDITFRTRISQLSASRFLLTIKL